MSQLDERTRVRGMALLCCHCVRNSAYYRAGWENKRFIYADIDFWRNANGNFLDTAVMEWCKLFADCRGKHYWNKVIDDTFLTGMLRSIGFTESEYEEYSQKMRTYRDKFLAHLDEERTMYPPLLQPASYNRI